MKLFRLFGDNNLPKLTEEQTSESNSIEQEQNEETQKVEIAQLVERLIRNE